MTGSPNTEHARAALAAALDHDPDTNDQTTLLEVLDPLKVLDEHGNVDSAKVEAVARHFNRRA